MLYNKKHIIKERIKNMLFLKRGSIKGIVLIIFLSGFVSCEDFVDVNAPKNLLVSEKVFNNSATVESALANIYFKMRNEGLLSGNRGMSALMGCYADELDYLDNDLNVLELYQNSVTASNTEIKDWWVQTYNLIYAANDIIEGLNNSSQLSNTDKKPYIGQALFIRAFLHSLLVNVYGNIPYIKSTDYIHNNTVSREEAGHVYDYIIDDLKEAIQLMEMGQDNDNRVIPNQITAKALLARMYLYVTNWDAASQMATEVINTSGYQLESDISKVFLKNSRETIWQFKPDGVNHLNTIEADFFVIASVNIQRYAMSTNLMEAFELGDYRKEKWVGEFTNLNNGNIIYFPYKYKETLSSTQSLEYSIVFRLAEQYLIRAEAKANLGQIQESRSDLNIIRNRAGLSDSSVDTKEALIDAILHEKRIELFSEHGHRWFDLIRTNSASEVLSLVKPNWQDTDVYLPIPESELELNPNLKPQNEGY